jgi:arylsulfatase A-like enzyme
MLPIAAALASPLVVLREPVAVPPLGRTDGWNVAARAGTITATPEAGGAVHLAYPAGTDASYCSARAPVAGNRTVVVRTQVRGDAGLGDIAALHLHLGDASGNDLVVARRRIDPGDRGWEAVEIRATATSTVSAAWLCWELRMQKKDRSGGLTVLPLSVEALTATSRGSALPLRRVILVTVETLRRDHLSLYGYARKTSPNLDALAREGARLDRHQAPAPYTHPSLASLITSRFPSTLGFLDNLPALPTAVPTIADVFAGAGYVTAAFNVQYVLSNRYGLNRAFHYYRNWANDTPSRQLNDELLPWLAAHGDDNLFLWVHYFDPHGPYRPPASFRAPFDTDAIANADTRRLEHSADAAEGVAAIPNYVFDKGKLERRHYVAGYDGDIAWWDSELGRLLRYLKERNWTEDTLVVVTADHGESMTDHGRFFCHGSLYEHDLHVPAVVWAPGRVKPGTAIAARTSHLDILPSLMDWAGIPAAADMVGRSFRPVVDGTSDSTAPPFSLAMVGREDRLRYAGVGDGPWKVVLDRKLALIEAYDLSRDPDERRNAVGAPPKAVRETAAAFRTWLQANVLSLPAPSQPAQALDPEDAERLRALGYLE